MEEKFKMTKDQVVESPKDVTLKGVIVDIKKSTFSKEREPAHLEKFSDEEKHIERLFIKVDCKYNEKSIMVEDTFTFYEEPSDYSNLGKFLIKYGTLEVGVAVKVLIGGKGFGKILIE